MCYKHTEYNFACMWSKHTDDKDYLITEYANLENDKDGN